MPQPWNSNASVDRVSVHASSTTTAPSRTNCTNARKLRISKTGSQGEKLLPSSVILQNNSACLTQCPVGHRLSADELPFPRANTALEDFAAILAMLAFFGFGAVLPFIWTGCLAAVCLCGSVPAMLFLALSVLDYFLPPGEVRLCCENICMTTASSGHSYQRARFARGYNMTLVMPHLLWCSTFCIILRLQ